MNEGKLLIKENKKLLSPKAGYDQDSSPLLKLDCVVKSGDSNLFPRFFRSLTKWVFQKSGSNKLHQYQPIHQHHNHLSKIDLLCQRCDLNQ